MVGCVIVKDGKIVGEGFHPKAGQPHAEVFALRDARDLAENATAYVSLEPCNHYGRTPPCTEALIKAKVKKVVVDQLGEGVTDYGGYYSQLLQEYDAIIVSPTSFTEQSSFPVSKEPGANQPLQILIARTPSPPIQFPVLTTEATSKVIIFTDKQTAVEPETARMGIETVVLDQLNLNTILEYCKHRGLCSVLLDLRGNFGGLEELLNECLEQNLLQKVVIEVLPLWHGSEERRLPMALKNLPERRRLKNLTSRISSESVVLEGYF
ncbi:hypothetical protein L1049_019016 [Liquidambar formosana]|uniref:CMP/dCMP-type deaminase domain-containing protein n=1 Tax=Liquidambar formosana TaxID=63359 RepID=A0AAP0RBU8_LIQFO